MLSQEVNHLQVFAKQSLPPVQDVFTIEKCFTHEIDQ